MEELDMLLQQAKSEAAAAFGNDGVYLEKYIQNLGTSSSRFL